MTQDAQEVPAVDVDCKKKLRHSERVRRVAWYPRSVLDEGLAVAPALALHPAVGIRGAVDASVAAAWAAAVLAADSDLTADFGGEQKALGRAFYTHLEGRAAAYFAGDSDAVVERVLPGMQAFTIKLLATMLGGAVRRRRGFCGPGVHVFPPHEKVARRGGVFHYDLEGLTAHDRARGARAVSFVVMLQPPTSGGGLSLYQKTFRGDGWDMDRTPRCAVTTTRSRAGDALLFSSLRLHRINGFRGDTARVSITCHAIEVDVDVWDCWF